MSNAVELVTPLAGYDPWAQADGYTYDEDKGEKAIRFIEKLLTHTKNSRYTNAGDPFLLEEWQKVFLRMLFGFVDAEGRRRYRTAYVEIPRKNGKSTLCAAIALIGLFADKEFGAECYCCAATRDQASLLFDIACGMVESSKVLRTESKIRKSLKRIIYSDSYLRAVSSDAHSLHGFNSHFVLADEVHSWTGGGHDLWGVMATSIASRAQPCMIGLTTAGHDKTSKCYELHEYGKRVAANDITDPTFLPLIYGIDEGADWRDPEQWAIANPNLGKSVNIEYIEAKCREAEQSLSAQNDFRRLHLNQWTSQRNRWLSMADWNACP